MGDHTQVAFDRAALDDVRRLDLANLSRESLDALLRQVFAKGFSAGAAHARSDQAQDVPRVTVTAAMVSELRAKTDASMNDCKQALVQANGDMAEAVNVLLLYRLRPPSRR